MTTAAVPLREYPVTIGILTLILAPLVTIYVGIAAATWVKIDRQQESLTEVRVGQAKLEAAVLRQNELLIEISRELRSR